MNIAFFMMSFKQDKNEANTIINLGLSKALACAGHNVSIICPILPGYRHYEILDGVHIFRLEKGSRLHNELFLFRDGLEVAKKKLDISHFDVIINNFASPIIGARTWQLRRREKGTRYVAMIRSVSSYSEHSFGFRSYRWSRFLKHYDMIITPLQAIKDRLVIRGIRDEKVRLMKSPINLSKFRPKNKALLKKKYKIKGRFILYYGHFKKVKGIEFLLDSMRYLKDDDVRVVLIHSRERVHDAYDKLIAGKVSALKGRAEILPYETDVVDYINMAECVCLPYPGLISTEGNPSCMLESMACKTPVVTSDLPELREIVEPGVHVLMSEPRNPKNLALVLERAISDKALRRKLIAEGYRKAQEFDQEKIRKEFVRLIESLG